MCQCFLVARRSGSVYSGAESCLTDAQESQLKMCFIMPKLEDLGGWWQSRMLSCVLHVSTRLSVQRYICHWHLTCVMNTPPWWSFFSPSNGNCRQPVESESSSSTTSVLCWTAGLGFVFSSLSCRTCRTPKKYPVRASGRQKGVNKELRCKKGARDEKLRNEFLSNLYLISHKPNRISCLQHILASCFPLFVLFMPS